MEMKKLTLLFLGILVLIIGGIFWWQLSIFGAPCGAANTARGFGRIQIYDFDDTKESKASIYYADTTNDALFFRVINKHERSVEDLHLITDINGSCWPEGTDKLVKKLAPGENDTVTLNCESKAEGDSFSVDITFEYNETFRGIKINHREGGTLRGSVDPPKRQEEGLVDTLLKIIDGFF